MEKKKLEEKYGKEIVEMIIKYWEIKKSDLKKFKPKEEKAFEDCIKRRIEIRGFQNQILRCIDNDNSPIFKKGKDYLCLGEVGNMEEHIILIGDDGKVEWGYHPEHFKILKNTET